MSIASIAQAVAAIAAIAAIGAMSMVGGGGVQSWSSDNGGCMIDGRGMHHGIGLGGDFVRVGIGCGHRVDGLHDGRMHNGRGIALDDRRMRDDGGRIGGRQGGTIAQAIAMAVGRNEASIGDGAQGGQDGDLEE